jgi:hypothetical protein
MQDSINSGGRFQAILVRSKIAFNKLEFRPIAITDQFPDLIKIVFVPSGEVVQSNHMLTGTQQILDQIGPDEPRSARDQPLVGSGLQRFLQTVKYRHVSR